MSGLRHIAKHAAEAVLGLPPAVRLALRRRPGQALVLAWHNILPAGAPAPGERSLHTDRAAFEAQLDVLTRFTRVVPLREIIESDTVGGGPVAAVTFDDAYEGTLAEGIPALAARGLPATIFVAPAFLGGRSFWWDRLAATYGGELPEAVRREMLDGQLGDDARIANAGAVPDLPAHARCTTLDALRAGVRIPGIEVASHTWSHRNLARLSGDERERELTRPAAWLDEHFPGWPRILSLPYGLGEDVAAEAGQAGYRAILRVEGGWYRPTGGNPPVLPRLNIPRGLSAAGLRLRLAGFVS